MWVGISLQTHHHSSAEGVQDSYVAWDDKLKTVYSYGQIGCVGAGRIGCIIFDSIGVTTSCPSTIFKTVFVRTETGAFRPPLPVPTGVE